MPTIEITTSDYAPEESDATPSDYLLRAGEAIHAAHGYDFYLMVGGEGPIRQLQINIPADAPGGKRAVTIIAPEPIVDLSGDVMTQTQFNAKFGN